MDGLTNRIENLIVKENKEGKVIEHGIKMSGGGAFSNKLDAMQENIILIEKNGHVQRVISN